MYAEFPEYQLALRDSASDQHLAHGNGVPLAWDGYYASLPRTAAEMVELALQQKRRGLRPTAFGALQAVVHPAHQKGGKSSLMLQAMASQATAFGMRALFAPIRPTHKTLYPLARIESYVGWVRGDGQAVDPWQRVHVRLGATPAGIVRALADRHRYAVRLGGLDRTRLPRQLGATWCLERSCRSTSTSSATSATYVEPHLWMHYRLVAEDARSVESRAA